AFDYWVMGLYPSEEDIAAVSQGKGATPVGKPRNAADVAWPPGDGAGAANGAAASAVAAAPVAAMANPAAIVPAVAVDKPSRPPAR
ncbi:MAG TPA: hypothetical protein VNN06_07215, partial [Ramlibacter sp.]|nr:hypothetical protein [Ramlibacter sp.]